MRKVCGSCCISQSTESFYKDSSRKDGFNSRCKKCFDVLNNKRPRRKQQIKEWQDLNRLKVQENVRTYGRANRLIKNQIEGKRRARIYNTRTGKVDYQEIFIRDNGICHLCKQVVTTKTLNFDHVLPLSKDGSHTTDNIKVAHAICNARKGAKV